MADNKGHHDPQSLQEQGYGTRPEQMQMDQMKAPDYVTRLDALGETPEWIDCPFCQQRAMTKVTHSSSDQTTMAAAVCCLCCGVITVCIPYLCGWFQETAHHCTNCGKQVTNKTHDGQVVVKEPPKSRLEPTKFGTVQPTAYPQPAQIRGDAPPGYSDIQPAPLILGDPTTGKGDEIQRVLQKPMPADSSMNKTGAL